MEWTRWTLWMLPQMLPRPLSHPGGSRTLELAVCAQGIPRGLRSRLVTGTAQRVGGFVKAVGPGRGRGLRRTWAAGPVALAPTAFVRGWKARPGCETPACARLGAGTRLGALRELSRGATAMEQAEAAAAQAHARLTVVVVAVTEREDAGCCETARGLLERGCGSSGRPTLNGRAHSSGGHRRGVQGGAERSVLAALALETDGRELTWSSSPPAEAFTHGSDHVGRDGCSAAQPVWW